MTPSEFSPMNFPKSEAYNRLRPVMEQCGLVNRLLVVKAQTTGWTELVPSPTGLSLAPHKQIWRRKVPTDWLVRVEYHLNGKEIFTHTEPWIGFPSDFLVAKLMLLPVR